MRKSDIVGRWIDIPAAIRKGADYEDEYGEEILEFYVGFDFVDGDNAFSVQLELSGAQVRALKRIGHVHMCGGQGCDDELYRFPLRSLEEEADRFLAACLTDRKTAEARLQRWRRRRQKREPN